jgi:hypothetical protein
MTFRPWEGGPWYYDTSEQIAFSFPTTVEDNKKKYTSRGVKQAEAALRFQDIAMRPPSKKLQNMLARGFIRNCPVESRHVQFADDIYGKNLGAIKGKTVRREVKSPVVSMNPVPGEIISRYPDVSLSIDIMSVNAVPFLTAISKELKIGHTVPVTSRHGVVIATALKRIIAKYERRGLSVKQVGAAGEFCKLEDLVNVDFDFAAKDDHEPTIERFIRTIKDLCRSQYNMLPFKHVPKAVIRHLVLNSVFWWNALPGNS